VKREPWERIRKKHVESIRGGRTDQKKASERYGKKKTASLKRRREARKDDIDSLKKNLDKGTGSTRTETLWKIKTSGRGGERETMKRFQQAAVPTKKLS